MDLAILQRQVGPSRQFCSKILRRLELCVSGSRIMECAELITPGGVRLRISHELPPCTRRELRGTFGRDLLKHILPRISLLKLNLYSGLCFNPYSEPPSNLALVPLTKEPIADSKTSTRRMYPILDRMKAGACTYLMHPPLLELTKFSFGTE